MFGGTTSTWEGYPSIIDGVKGPELYLLRGEPYNLRAMVLGKDAPSSAFGVSASPLYVGAVEEFDFWQDGEGFPSVRYDGKTYIKRALQSALLTAYQDELLAAFHPNVEHFALVGGSYCVEFLTQSPPEVVSLPTREIRNDWVNSVCQATATDVLGWAGDK